MELVQLMEYEGAYWFILRDIPPETLDRMQLQADIAYLAMMTGVKL